MMAPGLPGREDVTTVMKQIEQPAEQPVPAEIKQAFVMLFEAWLRMRVRQQQAG